MEYGIWSLHAAGGLWGDPRLARRHPILVPGGPAVGPANPGAAAFALNTLRHPIDGIAMPVAPGSPAYRAMELVARTASSGGDSMTTGPSGIFDTQEDGVPPVLNSWVLGAYTAMLGRLSAATAALEGSEIPNMTSDTGSDSEDSSYTEKYEREEYRCSMCSYACTIEKAFQRHLRAHAKGAAPETRVSCPVCGADRTSEVDLSRHMRRHRDDRYFCCDICIFRTVQLKKLIQHRRMHTGEKPHLCPHCAYRSARRDNLRSHVRRVHKKENLYCDTFSPRGMLQISGSTQPIRSPASSPASNAGSAN